MKEARAQPEVSVVVPTRNRPESAVDCARSLLRCQGLEEVVFVDQSDAPATETGLTALGDTRIRCIRSALRGAANARNVGIDSTRGRIIAFTDDDCRVSQDWLQQIARIFETDTEVAIVCGRVRVPPELRARGFAIEFESPVREYHHRYPPAGDNWGITANMAARREVFDRLGQFDPCLGAGAPLLAGEEPDLIFRVLKAGLKVVNANEVEVEHLGIRAPGLESSLLWRAYGVGTASAFFKHVRLGDVDAARLYVVHAGQVGIKVARNAIQGHRPTGLKYLLAFLRGTLSSLSFRIDPERRHYVPR
jgi:GT2 family glycosyltransferase